MEEQEKGIFYCGQTMIRQVEQGMHDVKDFATNCIHLADYYQAKTYFKQAEYLLFAALSMMPED